MPVRVQRRERGHQLLGEIGLARAMLGVGCGSRLVTWADRASSPSFAGSGGRSARWFRAKISGGRTSWATARSTSACQEKPDWNERRRSMAVACGFGVFASTLPSNASRSSSVTVGGRRSKGDPNQLGTI